MNHRNIWCGLLACAVVMGLCAEHAHAQAREGRSAERDRATAAQLTYGLLTDRRYGYYAKPFDDALSERVFDAYVRDLDPQHRYFAQDDLASLAKYATALDEAVKRGKLDPVYEIADVRDRGLKARCSQAGGTQPDCRKLPADVRDRDEILAIFLNAFVRTIDGDARYLSPFAAPERTGDPEPLTAPTTATRSVLSLGNRRAGVITVGSFYGLGNGSVSRDVARLAGELRQAGVDGVVLDLRGSPGGALREVIDVAGLFLGPVPFVQIRETGNRVSTEKAANAAAWTGPLVVLVDGRTASGAEMLAAAIQDHGRGLVVGETTYGRGSIQNPVDLDRGDPNSRGAPRFGLVNLTIAEAYRLDGRPIGAGVTPDVVLATGAPARHGASAPIPPARGYQAPVRSGPVPTRQPTDPASADPVLAEAAAILVKGMASVESSAGSP
ncbi:S41 family peptidase [Lysobacter niastensis]|uniref:Tail specific protease domain-containing protein n=1 Tax=Lysobacter niastensis TaxID=380629 RepID=A0ABS0B3I2_9GAMM|nr:S41 family peptidase [Lysobacter niastensis]MBF6022847.1 hypothetical protein [Lysobacter niastensis]